MLGAASAIRPYRPGECGGSLMPATRTRVLIVAPSLAIVGGQAVQADRLFRHLSEEPSLTMGFLPVNPRLPGLLGYLQRIKFVRTVVTEAAYVLRLLRTAREYDVLHVFSASYWSFLLAPMPAILAGRLFGLSTILNYRSGEAEDHLRRWPRTALPAIRAVTRIVVPSAYLVAVFRKFGFEAGAIYNVIDRSLYRFRARPLLQPRFLANRNLEPMYNVGVILRAFQIVQRQCPEATLVIAGDGSERASLEALAGELQLKGVQFLGQVPPDQMPDLYHEADIYWNASEIDNMPMSLVEAFCCGLPVITTDAGGIPYIVTHEKTGLLVSCGDAEAMAEAALRLLREPALAQRLVAAARTECDRYEWDQIRQEWVDLYHRLANK